MHELMQQMATLQKQMQKNPDNNPMQQMMAMMQNNGFNMNSFSQPGNNFGQPNNTFGQTNMNNSPQMSQQH